MHLLTCHLSLFSLQIIISNRLFLPWFLDKDSLSENFVPLSSPMPWMISIGFVLRTMIISPLPILIHCVADKDRTIIACAALQKICGSSNEDILLNCRSRNCTSCECINTLIENAPTDPVLFGFSCGLSKVDICALQGRFALGLEHHLAHEVVFDFQVGRPTFPCRPYLECEMELMKYHMMHDVPKEQTMPYAIVISGLPASGKTTICKHVLDMLGVSLSTCVNLDMDIVRTFHAQYLSCMHERGNSSNKFKSYDDIVPWLMEETNIERNFYSKSDGVVQSLLREGCNFVLPTVMDNERTLEFLKACVHKFKYRPILIGVQVQTETALTRASIRNNSGRFTPFSVIEGREQDIKASFAIAARFVASSNGTILLLDNNDKLFACQKTAKEKEKEKVSRQGECYLTGGLVDTTLKEAFRLHNGVVSVYCPELAMEYGLFESLLLPLTETAAQIMPSSAKLLESITPSVANIASSWEFGTDNELYNELGYIPLIGCLDPVLIRRKGADFEKSISKFASDHKLSREDYLSVINKWPHCNSSVMAIMETLGSLLRHRVAQVLRSDVAWPVGAVIFRKSSLKGNKATHLHQDIAYARFPGSQLFRATTWVPLVLHNADTPCVSSWIAQKWNTRLGRLSFTVTVIYDFKSWL